jgi:hypothetical protein
VDPIFERVRSFIGSAGASEAFDRLAVDVIGYQLDLVPAWRRLQGKLPKRVDPAHVRPFPAELYKREIRMDGPPPTHTFETSGTGSGRPGRVGYTRADLDLMDLAIRSNAARFLFPDGPGKTCVLVLAPDPRTRPGIIMSYGMQRLIESFSIEGGEFLFGERGPDVSAFVDRIQSACRDGLPLTLIGASFGFVHLMETLGEQGTVFRLPPGSRLMDAGGYKGRSRALSRADFRDGVERCFGIGPDQQTNLLGMTELGSQFYDHVVGRPADTTPRKQNPPWTRTWAVDPGTLNPQPPGGAGLLVHLDLANLHHPAFLLTQDLGRCFDDGFEIEGRVQGAEARGCSLAMDAFLSQQKAS